MSAGKLVLVLLVAGGVVWAMRPGEGLTREYGPMSVLCTIRDDRIDESSGVAASRLRKNIYFTQNDSGDSARFFAFDLTGTILGEYSLKGARALDWEDMATATVDGKPYVYLGDIGDNSGRRNNVVVYRVAEPQTEGKQELYGVETYTITYPDGPHNAEALLVAPSGDIYIVQKTSKGAAGIYRVAKPNASGKFKSEKVGSVEVGGAIPDARLITGGAVSPNGKTLVLRTYLAAYEFALPSNPTSWKLDKPVRSSLLALEQGEGITYRRDGNALVTTAEGTPCTVRIFPVKIGARSR